MPQRIREALGSLAEAATPPSGDGRFLIQLLSPGWGSSGYYSAEMIQRDGPAAFPAGTHCYIDHAGLSEQQDRSGLRSIRDLAAVLTEDARWDQSLQALVAEIRVLAPYREMLADLAPDIGMSITGEAVAETGEAEGRAGLLITELVQGYSCDFVAHAGRGGQVLQVIEHAVRRVREGYGLTASDQRDMLRAAVSDTYGGQDVYCWVRDYTDEWLVFERDYSNADGLFQVTYTITDGDVQFTSDPVEVYVHTQFLPVGTTPPAQPVPTQTSEGATMAEIDDAELRQLRESASTVQAAEQRATEAETRASEAERRAQMLTAAGVARGRIDTALAAQEAADLPDAIRSRIRERAVSDLPLTDAGELDTAAFDQRVAEAITSEREFVATLAEQMGAGRPRSLGGGKTPQDNEALTEAQNKLAEAFKGFGMTDEAAALAARGRN